MASIEGREVPARCGMFLVEGRSCRPSISVVEKILRCSVEFLSRFVSVLFDIASGHFRPTIYVNELPRNNGNPSGD